MNPCQNIRRFRSHSHSCPFCTSVYNNKRELAAHLEQVHGSKQQFKCHICGKTLKAKQNLDLHVAAHTGQQAYKCNICGKKFAQKTYYVGHMNMHAGSKAFQCKNCLKSFVYSTQLSAHKKMCSNISAY